MDRIALRNKQATEVPRARSFVGWLHTRVIRKRRPCDMAQHPRLGHSNGGAKPLRQLLYALLVALSPLATAQELIVHKDSGVEQLTRNEARLYLTMRLRNWPNGTLVQLFVLPDNDALHLRFVKSILGLYPYQLRRAWDRQLFSGTGQAPVTVSSVEEMLERVALTPGALGYVETSVMTRDIRTIEVH